MPLCRSRAAVLPTSRRLASRSIQQVVRDFPGSLVESTVFVVGRVFSQQTADVHLKGNVYDILDKSLLRGASTSPDRKRAKAQALWLSSVCRELSERVIILILTSLSRSHAVLSSMWIMMIGK